ncbi:hypothetical protein QP027_00670 [Corynebacterium breve]|uniref:TadE-like protein n=1 Tax=Corynebacterium breve TaxID=3049799 RepID=A0ABY8VF26_9CORY|nr:hypothetical protein [Corynebacterium breve]WIM67947.1 hypothetical protein QP027_00670 [Corynebacterium breve]
MWADDRGSVTIEAALSLATLIIVAAGIVAGIATMAAYIAAIDIAGAAARAHAIGVDYESARADITVSEQAGLVTVQVKLPAAIGTAEATATYPVEFR